MNRNSCRRTFIKNKEKTNHFAWALAIVMVEIPSQSFHHNAPVTSINFIPCSFNPSDALAHSSYTHTHKHTQECSMHRHVNTHEKIEKRKTGEEEEEE